MTEKLIDKFRLFVINFSAGELMENFFVSAIVSFLTIRAWLTFWGFPAVGRGEIHIAHILWGGLLMFLAVVLLLVFLNKESRQVASVIGGIGFGTFIDELGKFITHDNNYFFEPTIAIIYVVFVLLFLLIRGAERYLKFSSRDYAINALEISKEIFFRDLDLREKQRALDLLKQSDQRDPLIKLLKKMLSEIKPQTDPKPGLISQVKALLSDFYFALVKNKTFTKLLILVFLFSSFFNLAQAVWGLDSIKSVIDFGQLGSSIIAGILVIIGTYRLQTSKRLSAYEYYRSAILITIFFTQFFLFYKEQLSALVQLTNNIGIYLVVRYLITQEEVGKVV
ncbi:MAG: hypothetical protein ABID04_00175 [Patescibacteria group bacterium]